MFLYNSNSVCQKWKSVEPESLFPPHDMATAHQDSVTGTDALKVSALNIIFSEQPVEFRILNYPI